MTLVLGILLIASAGLWLVALVLGPKLVSRLGRIGPPGVDPIALLNGRQPKVSVLIAARNEEAGIGARLDNLFALQAPPGGLEIVVVSDGSTDRTGDVVRERAARCPADRALILIEQHPNRGKEVALGVAAERASGDIFALTDATTEWHPDVAVRLCEGLMQPGVGAASGRVVYRDAASGVADAFAAYQRFVVAQRRGGRSIQVSTSGACAAAWACCFSRYEPNVNSDLQLALLAAEAGLGTVYVDGAVALEDTRESLGEELRARMRIARRCLVSAPPLVRRLAAAGAWWSLAQLALQKWTRWAIWLPVGLGAAGLLLVAASRAGALSDLAWAGVFAAAIAGWLGWLRVEGRIGGLGRGVDALGYLVVAVVATFRAAVQIAKGQTSLSWQPERTPARDAAESAPRSPS